MIEPISGSHLENKPRCLVFAARPLVSSGSVSSAISLGNGDVDIESSLTLFLLPKEQLECFGSD